jgi:hypothetical protein
MKEALHHHHPGPRAGAAAAVPPNLYSGIKFASFFALGMAVCGLFSSSSSSSPSSSSTSVLWGCRHPSPNSLRTGIIAPPATAITATIGTPSAPNVLFSSSSASTPSPTTTTPPKLSVFDFPLTSLDRLGAKILAGNDLSERCGARPFGSSYGKHELCADPMPTAPCSFYSFGISTDYSFDSEFANATGCTGFAADPTVTHPSKLHPLVYFSQMAASLLDRAETTSLFPLTVTVPSVRKMLNHSHVAVLKMDCEGCEYSLARDILEEDPEFLTHVDQFAVEVHYSQRWMKSRAHLHSLAALVQLLEDAGLDLVHAQASKCSPKDQATGLAEGLQSLRLIDVIISPRDGQERHCHNYLFARV